MKEFLEIPSCNKRVVEIQQKFIFFCLLSVSLSSSSHSCMERTLLKSTEVIKILPNLSVFSRRFFVSFPESRKFLLYARQIEIRGVDIDNPYYNYIISFTVPDIDNVTVVDYDAVEHRIYWSDVRAQSIKRAFINGTGVETVVSAGKDNSGISVHPHIHEDTFYKQLTNNIFSQTSPTPTGWQ